MKWRNLIDLLTTPNMSEFWLQVFFNTFQKQNIKP